MVRVCLLQTMQHHPHFPIITPKANIKENTQTPGGKGNVGERERGGREDVIYLFVYMR